MIMVSFDFLSEPIRLDENIIQVLCLENPQIFRKILNAFIAGETEENKIIFSADFIPFRFKGNICVIDDYFRLSYSNTVMKKLYEQIEKHCNNEHQDDTIRLKTHIVNFMESLLRDFDYDLNFNYDISLTEIFKTINLRPVADHGDSLNTLLDYILILNKYVPQKCFVLFNLHLYFTEKEIELFYNDIVNNHIELLVIENRKFFNKNKYENVVVYDNDFCEIVENP